MKNTKEIILKTSLDLFNARGLSKVTLRTIAKTMGISQGNLNYHFKKRDGIIEMLYFQLVRGIDKSMEGIQHSNNAMQMMVDISKTIMSSFYEYRFFMLDFVQIMRDNEKISAHYSELTLKREKQFAMLLELLITHKFLRKEILPDEYKNMYKRIQIFGDFWISDAVISNKKITNETIKRYSEILMQAIFPYLTSKGQKEYHAIVEWT